jgi:Tfp pilus assembly protein PilF
MFSNKTHEKAHNSLKDGKIDKAIELYTKALLENPDDCNIISDRGVAYIHKNDQVNCLKDFNRGIELQPDYSYRYASRAYAKKHFGDIDGAVEDYEKAVELDPEDAIAQNNLGLLLEEKGYKKQAEERFKRADRLSKMEDGLYGVINDLEKVDEPTDKSEKEQLPFQQLNQDSIEKERTTTEQMSRGVEFKKVFTSRSQFKEFLNFIKNGFKLK